MTNTEVLKSRPAAAPLKLAYGRRLYLPRCQNHAGYVLRRPKTNVLPAISIRPVSKIESPELVAITKDATKCSALEVATQPANR
ncbi:MAG: hypothetical protein QM772_00845 [Ottowia sp.]|uniref:hypothetical protein n=1 Tax=Ottowia sp. TaxID=1898956 RepID=UPI0039E24B29